VYPADVERVRTQLRRSIRVQPLEPIEFRIVWPSGQLRTVQIRARLITDERGEPRQFIGATHDITDHKDTTARLVFTDRMASVGALAGGVAHEINNPLAFISAHLELITDELGPTPPGDIASLLADARGGVDRIKNVVRGLQAFSSHDDGARTAVDLPRVLDLAVLMTANQIRHRALLVREDRPLPQVLAHSATLTQVFTNLLINAAEAIPEGDTEHHRVSITMRTDDAGWAIIEIRDTGRGIPREIQNQIFDPFFTTKPIGKGTGLGLSICHGVVGSLGGELSFTTAPGAGTVFHVALPPAGAQPRPPEPPPEPAVAPRPRTRVLIIDDEVVFAHALRRLLSKDKHQLSIIHDGREAIARAEAGDRFDAIVCDLMMPAMSGMELYDQLTAVAPEQAARMIFLTGGAFSPAAKEFLARVPNRWFEKPCDLDVLRAAIARVAST
jgi:signal transduction histidine kinase/CheY-like chemotaxis protein